MDQYTREDRQKEFTLYLILFILLVIVGAIQSQSKRQVQQTYPNPYYSGHDYPHGYSANPHWGNLYGYHPYPGSTPFGWW